jgi:RNA polymerase sigma-70 factor (ECF subfamily)
MSPTDGERYTTDPVAGEGSSVDAVRRDVAESELADRYWDRVRVLAARRLRDAAAAEDVAQETLRRVVDALRGGRVVNLEALPGFVFQTAVHVCLQRDRSARREARALARLDQTEETTEANALAALISEERRIAVRRALRELDEPDRALLQMLFFDHVETGVAAERLGVSRGAVRVRKHRTLQRLSELLRGADG